MLKHCFQIIVFCFICCLFSCNDDETALDSDVPIIKELDSYLFNYEELSSFNWIKMLNDVSIVNSEIDLIEYLGDDFLSHYPMYKDVDFSQYSLLLFCVVITHEYKNKGIQIILDDTQMPYNYKIKINYLLINTEYESYKCELIGLVVNKIDSGATTKLVTTMSYKKT